MVAARVDPADPVALVRWVAAVVDPGLPAGAVVLAEVAAPAVVGPAGLVPVVVQEVAEAAGRVAAAAGVIVTAARKSICFARMQKLCERGMASSTTPNP